MAGMHSQRSKASFGSRSFGAACVLLSGALACQSQSRSKIFINEVFSNGPGSDWIELFNKTAAEQDIGEYRIYDDSRDVFMIPRDTVLPAGGFLVLTSDGMGEGLHTSFRLTAAGESITLEDHMGRLVDRVQFPELAEAHTFGRLPDGSDNWTVLSKATEGAPNRADSKPSKTATGAPELLK